MVGPGTVPLKVRAKREYPSGDTVVFSTDSQYYFPCQKSFLIVPHFVTFCCNKDGLELASWFHTSLVTPVLGVTE